MTARVPSALGPGRRARGQRGAAVMIGLIFFVAASSLGLVALLTMSTTSSRIATAQELDAQLHRATDGAMATALVVLQDDPTGATSTPVGDGACAEPLGSGPKGRLDVDDGLGHVVGVTATCDKGTEEGTYDVRLLAVVVERDAASVRGTARVAVRHAERRRVVEVLDWNLGPIEPEPDAPPTTVAPSTTTTVPAGGVTWDLRVTSDWTAGYCAEVVVRNPTSDAVTWKVTVPVDGTPYAVWNGVWAQDGPELHVKGEHWNHTIQPGSSTTFGFCADRRTAPPTTLPGGDRAAVAELRITSDWKAGYCADVTVTNPGPERLDWVVTVPIEGDVSSFWNGVYGRDGDRLTVRGADWNRTLAPKASTSFGFCANR